MANPTTNFGWVMPTSASLVTNLPADFNTFGQAVDTSMAELKGGTTGQILSKTSATDMDFTWITNDVGDITAVNTTAPLAGGGTSGALTLSIASATTAVVGAVQLSDSTSTTSSVLAATSTAVKSSYDLAAAAVPKSTVTTAGDVIYATGSSAVTRLGIGTTGQILTVASGVPSWATPSAASSGLTKIITSTFSSVANTGTTFDGCFTSTYDNYIIIMSALNGSTNNQNFQWQLRNAGSTTTTQYAGSYTQGTTLTTTSSASAFNLLNLTTNTSQQAALNMNFYRNSYNMNWTYQANCRGVSDNSIFGGGFQNTLANLGADGFILSAASGNISGIVTVYGVQK
jgi:hypothetical protein